jgi:hypothetical protein
VPVNGSAFKRVFDVVSHGDFNPICTTLASS